MFSLGMTFDPTGLNKAMDVMRQRAKKDGTGLAWKNARFFVRLSKKIGWDSAPSKDELYGLVGKYGWRLKRKKLTGQKRFWKGAGDAPLWLEVERRVKARGTYAKAWRFRNFEDYGGRIRIWIHNTVKYAGEINERDNTAPRAANYISKRFQDALQRTARNLSNSFGK
jgi:hypothetical protein